MKTCNVEVEVEDGLIVPAPVRVRPIRNRGYGGVPGLPDEELADPYELERWASNELWGPVLSALPPVHRHREDDDDEGASCVELPAVSVMVTPRQTDLEARRHRLEIEFAVLSVQLTDIHHRVLRYVCEGVVQREHIHNADLRRWLQLKERLDEPHEIVSLAGGRR